MVVAAWPFVWLTMITAYLRFSRVYPGFLGRKQGGRGEKLELIPSAHYCAVICDRFAPKSVYNREIRRGGGGEAMYKPTILYSTLSLSLFSPNIVFGAIFTMLRVLSQV